MQQHKADPVVNTASFPIPGLSDAKYRLWRKKKLERHTRLASECQVEIDNPYALTATEFGKIRQIVNNNNFVIYQYRPEQHGKIDGYRHICKRLGLIHAIPNPGAQSNNVTRIEVAGNCGDNSTRPRYIPYSSQALNWHTDGYYNHPENQVRSFVLHCQRRAGQGGENCLMDHEIAYLLLRDRKPEWANALCHPECFTIPANFQDGKLIRAEFRGAVFSTDPVTAQLYARYTGRRHHIQWQQNQATTDALAFLKSLFADGNPWSVRIRLEPGQGVICNNVLHNRSAFADGDATPGRCLHRIRFKDRINAALA